MADQHWQNRIGDSRSGEGLRQLARILAGVEEPAQAITVMERPGPVKWQLPPVVPDDLYLETAKRIGLNSATVVQARLDRFLVKHGWPVYPYGRVWAFLEMLADQESRKALYRIRPVWAPLRNRDVDEAVTARGGHIYDKAVPLHALQKVEALEAEFGEGVLSFHVSDYQAQHPDPFLMVWTGSGDPYVIDVWDEPGFGV